MTLFFDSFWRAAAYCLHPRVILLSMLPVVLMAALALGLGTVFWEPALDAMREMLESWQVLGTLNAWLQGIGAPNLKAVLAPLLVVFLSTPVIVVVALLLVATLMTPWVLTLVAVRRFPRLERRHGGSMLGSLWLAGWSTLAALAALVVTLPLWLVPPLVLVLPPLIWGWLTYKVMTYDVLSEHASRDERVELVRRHRAHLLGMGLICGYFGAAPSLVWASGALAIVFAPVLVPVAVWIYTLVFAFSALWFAHFLLGALAALRIERESSAPPGAGGEPLAEAPRALSAPHARALSP